MKNTIIILVVILILISCDLRPSGFGASNSVTESKSQNFLRARYVPNQFNFHLLDNSLIRIDTAWAETLIYSNKGQKESMEQIGYNFVIPIKKQEFDKFLFTFSLLDSTNRAFTNGIESTRCVLAPKFLKDTIDILVEEKNPDTAFGWIKPIKIDTIRFIKVKDNNK